MRLSPRIFIVSTTILVLLIGWSAGGESRAIAAGPHSRRQQDASTDTPIPTVAIVTSTPAADGSITHVVQYGQTLITIASAYGIKLTALKALNNLTSDYLEVGDKLIIQLPVTPTVTVTNTVKPTSTRRPTATPRPPTETPTITLTPTVTLTPTPTSALASLRRSINNQNVGIGLIALCAVGLVLVGFTFFRGK